MKRFYQSACLAVIVFGFLLISCGAKSPWEQAQSTNTMEAYETFIKNNPDSEHIREAYSSMESLFFENNKFAVKPVSFTLKEQHSNIKLSNQPGLAVIKVKDPEKDRFLTLDFELAFEPDKAITNKNNAGYNSRQIHPNYIILKTIESNDKQLESKSYPAIGFEWGKDTSGKQFVVMDGSMMWISYLKAGKDGKNINFKEFLFQVPKDLKRFAIYYRDQCIKKDVYLRREGDNSPAPTSATVVNEQVNAEPVKDVESAQQEETVSKEQESVDQMTEDKTISGMLPDKKLELQPVRLAGNKLEIIKRIQPVYPEPAKKNGIRGMVVLEVTVNESGKVVNVNVLSGHPQLNQAAIDAVYQWEFKPYNNQGVIRSFISTISVSFLLN